MRGLLRHRDCEYTGALLRTTVSREQVASTLTTIQCAGHQLHAQALATVKGGRHLRGEEGDGGQLRCSGGAEVQLGFAPAGRAPWTPAGKAGVRWAAGKGLRLCTERAGSRQRHVDGLLDESQTAQRSGSARCPARAEGCRMLRRGGAGQEHAQAAAKYVHVHAQAHIHTGQACAMCNTPAETETSGGGSTWYSSHHSLPLFAQLPQATCSRAAMRIHACWLPS